MLYSSIAERVLIEAFLLVHREQAKIQMHTQRLLLPPAPILSKI